MIIEIFLNDVGKTEILAHQCWKKFKFFTQFIFEALVFKLKFLGKVWLSIALYVEVVFFF